MGTYRISQLAERAGIAASTLRFYDRTGLLPADRSRSGYRLYGEPALDRLGFIQTGKTLGLSLEEIGELLAVWESGACRELQADLRPRLQARIEQATRRRAELTEFSGVLAAAIARLEALPDRAGPCDPECGFPRQPHAARGDPSPCPSETGQTDAYPSPHRRVERWRAVPVACALDAGGIAERASSWRQALASVVARRSIPDGLEVTVPVERAARIAELAVAEQSCCPFFDFQLRFDGTYAHLTVRAPAAGQQLLADLFTTA